MKGSGNISIGLKDAESVNADMTLGDLGLDSLMGVEVKQTLERDLDLVLAMQEVRHLTISKLQQMEDGVGSHGDNMKTDSVKDSQNKGQLILVEWILSRKKKNLNFYII